MFELKDDAKNGIIYSSSMCYYETLLNEDLKGICYVAIFNNISKYLCSRLNTHFDGTTRLDACVGYLIEEIEMYFSMTSKSYLVEWCLKKEMLLNDTVGLLIVASI